MVFLKNIMMIFFGYNLYLEINIAKDSSNNMIKKAIKNYLKSTKKILRIIFGRIYLKIHVLLNQKNVNI